MRTTTMMSGSPVIPERHAPPPLRDKDRTTAIIFAFVSLTAFVIFWLSSFRLVARGGTQHFHVDTWLYAELAEPNLFARLLPDSQLSRIFRFHPVTVVLAAGWMKIVAPLGAWLTPAQLLKALFAAVGALGVWAALLAFAFYLPRRQAVLWGAIYAGSLGIWYFSSIEESKIVTASLTALYIATYLRMRDRWTVGRALQLSAILFIACLNEIVAAFLVALPLVDAVVREGWAARRRRLIAAHVLVPILALLLLEGTLRSWSPASGIHSEGANHFSMFMWYASQTKFTLESIYYYLAGWLFFSVAAPESHANHWRGATHHFGGIFMPGLANYAALPLPGALVALFATLIAAMVGWRRKIAAVPSAPALLLALFAYAFVRAAFFFVFNPKENMLFSPSAILAHLLLLAIPFAATSLSERTKATLLVFLAMALFANNGRFIIG